MVKKAHGIRLPHESNLLLSILFKAFEQIDPRIARHFNVLIALLVKLEAKTYWK